MEIKVDRSLHHWWFFLVRGILFTLVGIYMIASPVASFVTLGFLFGLAIFIAGVAELIRVTRDGSQASRSWHLALGIIDVLLGVALMVHVAASMAILRILLGLWFLFSGFSLFSIARGIGNSWILIAGAILVFVFGLLILFNPTFGDMTIILWVGIAFIINGLFNIAIAITTRRILP